MEFVGGVTGRGVQLDQLGVHGVAVGEIADPRMLVVAGRGQDVGREALAIADECRPDVRIDLGGHPIDECRVVVISERHAADGLVRGEQLDLGHGRLDQAPHGRAARRSAVPMPFGHGGEHLGHAAEAGHVAVLALFGVERELGQQRQHAVDRVDEGVADGELDERHGGRARHVLRHAADEVECLQLDLDQPGLVELSRLLRRAPPAVRSAPARTASRSRGAARRSRGSRRAIRRVGRRRALLRGVPPPGRQESWLRNLPQPRMRIPEISWCRWRAVERKSAITRSGELCLGCDAQGR